MAIDKVKEYFQNLGISNRIQEFATSSATVLLAANALNCIPARIAKTLAFKIEDRCVLIVTSGDAKVDNARFKEKFKVKATMLTPDEVIEMVGHEVGGVCPFAIKDNIEVYTDISLKRFNTVFPACGSSNSAIELSCEELFEFSNSLEWIDVCKSWQNDSI